MPSFRVQRGLLQRGLSLVELMVALAIGLFLLLGLVQIFAATRASFGANEGLARVQENSRFAVEFMREDLRMAGHMGCLNEIGYRGVTFNHLLSATPTAAQWPYRFDYPVEVFEFTGTGPGQTITLNAGRTTPVGTSWTPNLPAALVGDALDGSDVIVVRYLSADYAKITSINYAANAEVITVNPVDSGFVLQDSIYGITDCENLSLFQIKAGGSVNTGGLNVRNWTAPENAYGRFNTLHRYHFVAYYVGMGAGGEPGLFRRELAADGMLGPNQEVVPGVESLQVMLGVNLNLRSRTGGDVPDRYLTAAQVNAGGGGIPWATPSTPEQRWASVVNFRLGMLIRSPQGSSMAAPTALPRIADTLITPPVDGRVRQTYETQIAIRNRIRG